MAFSDMTDLNRSTNCNNKPHDMYVVDYYVTYSEYIHIILLWKIIMGNMYIKICITFVYVAKGGSRFNNFNL